MISEYAEENVDLDPLAPPDEAAWRKAHVSRLRKWLQWISSPLTLPRLLLSVTLMQPALSLLGSFFAGARMLGDSACHSLEFCHRSTSPAEKAILSIFRMLENPQSRHWLPFLQGTAWNSAKIHAAACGAYEFAAQLCLKNVWPFDLWPLELGKLVHDSVPAADKVDVGNCFYDLRECCVDGSDGCTWRLHKLVATRADVDSPNFLEVVSDIFQMLRQEAHRLGDPRVFLPSDDNNISKGDSHKLIVANP